MKTLILLLCGLLAGCSTYPARLSEPSSAYIAFRPVPGSTLVYQTLQRSRSPEGKAEVKGTRTLEILRLQGAAYVIRMSSTGPLATPTARALISVNSGEILELQVDGSPALDPEAMKKVTGFFNQQWAALTHPLWNVGERRPFTMTLPPKLELSGEMTLRKITRVRGYEAAEFALSMTGTADGIHMVIAVRQWIDVTTGIVLRKDATSTATNATMRMTMDEEERLDFSASRF